MHVYRGEKPQKEKEKRKTVELTALAKEILANKKRLTYSELLQEIELLMDVKERTAKSYIRFMSENGIVVKDNANTANYILGKL